MVFHSFVFMQCFNEINARQIADKVNIFARIHLSKMFVAVLVGTVAVQFLLVEALGRAGPIFKTVPLTARQHGICLLFGLGSLPVGVLMRFIPVPKFASGASANSVGPCPPGGSERRQSDRELTEGKPRKETGLV